MWLGANRALAQYPSQWPDPIVIRVTRQRNFNSIPTGLGSRRKSVNSQYQDKIKSHLGACHIRAEAKLDIFRSKQSRESGRAGCPKCGTIIKTVGTMQLRNMRQVLKEHGHRFNLYGRIGVEGESVRRINGLWLNVIRMRKKSRQLSVMRGTHLWRIIKLDSVSASYLDEQNEKSTTDNEKSERHMVLIGASSNADSDSIGRRSL